MALLWLSTLLIAAAGKNPIFTTAFSSGVAPCRTIVRPLARYSSLSCPQRVCTKSLVPAAAAAVRTRTMSTLTTTTTTTTTVLNASPTGHNDEIFAEINNSLMDKAGFELRYVSLDVASYFDPLSASSTSKTISLETFDPLRLEDEDEKFFPKVRDLLVRHGMKRIFRYFENDVLETSDRRALFGSPGTGTSLLFFLAAVWKATYSGQKVVYFRKTKEEPISIFYMFPDGDDKVGIYFKRFTAVELRKNSMIKSLRLVLSPILLSVKPHLVEMKRPLLFVDGPNHDDKENVLMDNFDYYCSSGGRRIPGRASYRYFVYWILEGWSRDEMMDALTTTHNTTKDLAIEMYNLCGGDIKEAVALIQDEGRAISSYLERTISQLDENKSFELAGGSCLVKDQLRTMLFLPQEEEIDNKFDMLYVIQAVDSAYALGLLFEKLSTKNFLLGYQSTMKRKAYSVADSYFELF
jgi:hypothetical protein